VRRRGGCGPLRVRSRRESRPYPARCSRRAAAAGEHLRGHQSARRTGQRIRAWSDAQRLVERNPDNSWGQSDWRTVTVRNHRWSGGRPRQDSNLRARLRRPVLNARRGLLSTQEPRAEPLQSLQTAQVCSSSFHEPFHGGSLWMPPGHATGPGRSWTGQVMSGALIKKALFLTRSASRACTILRLRLTQEPGLRWIRPDGEPLVHSCRGAVPDVSPR
jgi:hypothetical protein